MYVFGICYLYLLHFGTGTLKPQIRKNQQLSRRVDSVQCQHYNCKCTVCCTVRQFIEQSHPPVLAENFLESCWLSGNITEDGRMQILGRYNKLNCKCCHNSASFFQPLASNTIQSNWMHNSVGFTIKKLYN